ncbi:endopeptidase La [candidate division KSB1 bacterium]|nr:MAG: endopeptidase La [candidate division KSB1 bacterium 4484_219]RKY80614.1 MAG: endopeptidase La [candidate division KSB1 bacterium]RKY90664.1 MAG: endopeptidase La [candidate division KSB1 bacterium]
MDTNEKHNVSNDVIKEELPGAKDESEIEKIEIPDEVPILALRDTVIYPFMVSPLFVARPKSIKLIDDVLIGNRILGLVAQRKTDVEDPKGEDLFKYGTVATILKMLKFPDGSVRVLVQGLTRMEVLEYVQTEPYLKAKIQPLEDVIEKSLELEALAKNITIQFQKIVNLVPQLPDELQIAVMNISHPGKLADLVASNLNLSLEEKQQILEAIDVKKRLEKLTIFINRELQVLEVGTKIQSQVQSELSKNQREYFLRQQLEAIRKELGEEDERTMEIKELKEKIKAAKMPKDVEKEAMRELDRLSKMPPGAAEYTVSRTYLDWLIALPWSVSTEDNLDIAQAQKVLDEDHYDLDKVKERILEYLAVRKLKSDMKGPILCFVGPPGVGKTSLGRSIARALGRKFVRISLGGARDEAEIRGHRRTYIGALPGRIIQGIRNAGSNNPVFMLDEVDKLGVDFRGDPSSALLEVLDPEQNYAFVDHYLDVPFDLTKVMFITTANLLDPIPAALRDRMEVLELPGYTEEEKLHIAKKYLIPKQLEAHGLTADHLVFDDEAIMRIVREYTREAGLRNLEREIAAICRRVARKVAEGETEKQQITESRIPEFLGPPRFFFEVAERTSEPGVATGLAWTPSGGDILFIEASKMPGKKGLILTGHLGEVMKESAQAALSYIRSKAKELGVNERFFDKYDIHIHVPAGAIPKDGPSAGVTISTALLSLLREEPVRSDVAMTGEITLRGKILPVGGIKEKILAAKRAGIKVVILPEKNKKDLEEVPQQAKDELQFHFVDTLDEVFEIAFDSKAETKKQEREESIAAEVP